MLVWRASVDTILVAINAVAPKPGRAVGLDNIATEQIKNFGPEAKKWLLALYNYCLTTRKLPNIWKKAHVTALLKPGKDPSLPKSYRPISLLSHTYKLFERLILTRVNPVVDEHLIPEQAGFPQGNPQPAKYSTSPSTSRMVLRRTGNRYCVCWPFCSLWHSQP